MLAGVISTFVRSAPSLRPTTGRGSRLDRGSPTTSSSRSSKHAQRPACLTRRRVGLRQHRHQFLARLPDQREVARRARADARLESHLDQPPVHHAQLLGMLHPVRQPVRGRLGDRTRRRDGQRWQRLAMFEELVQLVQQAQPLAIERRRWLLSRLVGEPAEERGGRRQPQAQLPVGVLALAGERAHLGEQHLLEAQRQRTRERRIFTPPRSISPSMCPLRSM